MIKYSQQKGITFIDTVVYYTTIQQNKREHMVVTFV